MIRICLVCLVFCAACTDGTRLATPGELAMGQARQGDIELVVKSRHAAIIADLRAAGGPALSAAFDAAGVPAASRPARIVQLQSDLGLYEVSPGALVAALALMAG